MSTGRLVRSLNVGTITSATGVTIAPRPTRESPTGSPSCREPEVDDVAVLHEVIFAFEPHFAVIAAGRHRAARDEVIVADHFRPDESARDVAVNLARGELGRRAARYRPRAALVFADREERNIPEKIVTGTDDAV